MWREGHSNWLVVSLDWDLQVRKIAEAEADESPEGRCDDDDAGAVGEFSQVRHVPEHDSQQRAAFRMAADQGPSKSSRRGASHSSSN